MKRLIDVFLSGIILVFFSPIILLSLTVVWLSDFHPPLFFSCRVGFQKTPFQMVKIRTMFWKADQRLSITPQNDDRVTFWGRILRTLKWDELPQFWNVLKGDMSLIGPRPDVFEGGVSLYTPEEKAILTVRPGILDLSSIVFSKEGALLKKYSNPKDGYYKEIFPLKKRLMLFYVQNNSLVLDFLISWGGFLLFFSHQKALQWVLWILSCYKASASLIREVEKIKKFSHSS